jgi:tRNA threonylcarbamoyl adenosine modification protein (Sua5/YciO/YrdC/YwlC family)
MGQYLEIHKDNPQARLINQVASVLRQGGVIVYPTDSCYALGCHIGDKTAMERIIRIRQLTERHNMTLICRDLSVISSFAKVGNADFRLIKSLTPGPYTFLLKATRDVPKRLQHPKRKTIGLRVPDNNIVRDLLESLEEPIISTSLILPGEEFPMNDPYEIQQRLLNEVDIIINGGQGDIAETTVLDLTMGEPHVVREGLGDISRLIDLT